jgi:hypothetical protein
MSSDDEVTLVPARNQIADDAGLNVYATGHVAYPFSCASTTAIAAMFTMSLTSQPRWRT